MNRHSSGGSGRPRDGAEPGKRERILEAAVRVFADKGFYTAKVSEIAHEAGVADGTIYLYFKSKDDLLISLFEDCMAEVNANVRAALAAAPDDDPVEKLRSVVRLHLELVERYPHLAEVLTVELRQSAKFMKEYAAPRFGEFLRLLASPIEQGQRMGIVRDELDAPMIARALFGALDELALAWLLRRRSAAASASAPASTAASGDAPLERGPAAHTKKTDTFELTRVAAQLADLFIDGLRRPPAKRRAS